MSIQEKESVKEAIMQTTDLPTLPSNVLLLMDMMRDPATPAAEAIELIEQDQVLTASILKLLNSSYYGQARAVDTIAYAVAILGYREIWNLILCTSVMEIISEKQLNLWNHSFSSSVLVRDLVKEEGIKCSSRIQLSTLMHDLGKVVLLTFDPNFYETVHGEVSEDYMLCQEAEIAMFGVDHAQVGGWLLEFWGLSEDQIIPISQHHCSELPEKYGVESVLIQLADYIDHAAREHHLVQPSQDLLKQAGLGEVELPVWIEKQRALIEEMGLSDIPSEAVLSGE